MTKGILVVMFSFVVLILQAQKENDVNVHGRITGKVVDSLSGEPMEYVTITILMQGNKNPVNGSISDKSGNFLIDHISQGNYRILIEFMGFQPFTFNNIDVTSENLLVDLKTILMVKDITTLKDVIITAKGKIIDNKIDKVVFNAENDLTSQGGVAIDILKKVPQVSVDIDGTVELAGSSSIRFLIDGKPSSAFGSNITDVLQSIPASQIKSIEVVTNPGSKYDAQGIGGIINIILKKSNVRGYNANLSLTAGTRQENGSLNLSARKNNFGINGFISGNKRLAANASNNYQRISQNISDSTTDMLNQDGSSSFTRYGMQSGLGFDWTVKKKNNFSGSLNYNEFGNTGSGFLNQSQITTLNDGSGEIISNILTHNNNSSSFRNHGIDANLGYKRTFTKEGRDLEINANSSFENNNNKANNNQFLMLQDSLIYGSNNINPGKENETEIKIDYTEPLSKKVILGTGAKLSSYNINSSSDVLSFQPYAKNYLFDSSLSNYLRYHQKIYSVYAELSFPAGDLFDAKFGGRYERTNIYSYYSNAQEQAGATGYNTFVPSVFLLRKLTDSKTIKLSYSKRIERPDYGDLNPFINTSDPKNISSGNPYLKPEQGSRYEFSFSNDLGSKGSYVITAFFRNNKDDIQNFIIYYPSLSVGDSTYTNVADRKSVV